jgi:hypothetical protein
MKILTLILVLFTSTLASAQPAKPGTITGTIVDKANKAPLAGVTVVFTGPAIPGEEVALTDERGVFSSSVPAGTYNAVMYFNDKQFTRNNIVVKAGKKATMNVTLDAKYEPIVIKGKPVDAFTISGDGYTFVGDDLGFVTFTEKGKKPIKAQWANGPVEVPGGAVIAVPELARDNSNNVEIFVNKKLVATISRDGKTKLPGKQKPVYFDDKGNLVNSALKLKVVGTTATERDDLMVVVASFLHAKL